MEYDHFVSVAGLVKNEQGQILMILSPDRGWEYPGGMVEQGETLQEALRREIWEETGVTAEAVAFAGITKNMTRNIVNVDFICRYVSGEPKTSPESLEVRWVTPEEAVELVTLEVTKRRLEGMLTADGRMYCFGFQREPFQVFREETFPIK